MEVGAIQLVGAFVLGSLGVYYIRSSLRVYFDKQKKISKIKETPFSDFRNTVVEHIVSDEPEKLSELLPLIFTYHPSHNLEEITHHRNNGGLLALACRLGRASCARILIANGANLNVEDINGETCLHFASKNGKSEVIRILLENGANPNARNCNDWTPLHWTSTNGRTEGTKLLIEFKADVSALSDQARSPLHIAVQNGHYEDSVILLENGADISIADNDGNTPILACSKNGSLRILELLLSYGANLNDRNKAGFTPLLRAADRGLAEFVITLLRLDPKKNLEELVSVIDSISELEGQGQEDSEQERQQKLSGVLQKVIQCEEFLEPFLQLLSEKIFSLGLSLMENPSCKSQQSLQNGTTQLIWLMDFIVAKEPHMTSIVIPVIINHLSPLWIRIDKTLSLVEVQNCDTTFLIRSVCPVIRMYHRIVQASTSCEQDEEQLREMFQSFVDKHSEILWEIIQNNGTMLIDQLDFALFTPARNWDRTALNLLLSFEQQREWLEKQLQESQRKYKDENITITVKRGSLGENSCSSLLIGGGNLFKGKFNIVFEGEEASGAGVRREWFNEVSRELFNPNNALFLRCHDGTLQPNPASGINLDHLSYFRFAGRVIALAIYHSELIDAHFTRAFYKHMLGIPPCYKDFESTDPEYFKNLDTLLSLDSVEDLELTFEVEEIEFGERKVMELKEGGRKIPVTKENVAEYVQLLTELKMTRGIEQQITSFLQGFNDIIPPHLLCIFNEFQLELLISGIPHIDAEDWEKNSKLNGYNAEDPQIIWFWEIVREREQPERAALLQFVTGTSRVPAGGFSCLQGHDGVSLFTILRTENLDSLPTSGTCFNLLRLPAYTTKAIMKEKLDIATTAGARGFSFA